MLVCDVGLMQMQMLMLNVGMQYDAGADACADIDADTHADLNIGM